MIAELEIIWIQAHDRLSKSRLAVLQRSPPDGDGSEIVSASPMVGAMGKAGDPKLVSSSDWLPSHCRNGRV
jgi:hypothetical protein